MVVPDFNYRPNPDRAVHIVGDFDDKLAATVLPEIVALRTKSADPITLYINSRGGALRILDMIEGALRCADADGRRCRLITAALGEVGSAAATLLALGEYAIVYPHSALHYHGARMRDVAVTMEDASSLASDLLSMNRATASKIARKVINRVVRRYVQLLPEIKEYYPHNLQGNEVTAFCTTLAERLSRPAAALLSQTHSRIQKAEALSDRVFSRVKFKDGETLFQSDMAVMRAVIAYEAKQTKQDDARIDEQFLQNLVSDYSLLREFHLGEHYRFMRTVIRSQGPAMLDSDQFQKFAESSFANRDEEINWLYKEIGPELRSLWHFSVLLCRNLQSGENRLTAEDAYWLGIVDEVMGTLPGERADAENPVSFEPPAAPPQ